MLLFSRITLKDVTFISNVQSLNVGEMSIFGMIISPCFKIAYLLKTKGSYVSFPYRFLGGRDAKGFHPQMSTEET